MHPPEIRRQSQSSIGVFDSGVGGLSVLAALRRTLPEAALLYCADSAHAPYGERDAAHIAGRSLAVAETLIERGAVAIVVACNTATAVAIEALRDRWPGLPIVGVEPGIKPAVALTRTGRIGVMATPATLASERYARLARLFEGRCRVVAQPCPGLAGRIESSAVDDPALAADIEAHCAPLREAGVDVVVLGCTHYAFVREAIEAALGPRVTVIDTAEAVANRTAGLCRDLGFSASGETRLMCSGDIAPLARFARAWLPFAFAMEAAPGEGPAAC